MIVGYVKKENIPVKLLDKLKYYLGFIKIEQIGQSYVIKIPIKQKELMYIKENNYFKEDTEKEEIKNKRIEKKIKKIIDKLIKYTEKYRINNLVFSDILSSQKNNLETKCFESWCREILKDKGYIKEENNIYNKNIHILNGRKIIEYMQYEILEYILQIQNKKISSEDIYFLIKKDSKLDLEFLNRFVENAKTVNIVTNDINRFKEIQETLYEKENILIGVSNNKNKALKRAKYIFNINMNLRELEKLKINRDAILIHIRENIKYCKNSFNGINISNINLKIPDEYLEEFERIYQEKVNEFNLLKMYEVILMQKIYQKKQSSLISSETNIYQMNYQMASEIIKNDEVKIIGVIGNCGEISKEELIKQCTKVMKTYKIS